MTDPRLKKLAELLVHYSAKVKPDDFVVVQAEGAATEWIVAVAAEAVRVGDEHGLVRHWPHDGIPSVSSGTWTGSGTARGSCCPGGFCTP